MRSLVLVLAASGLAPTVAAAREPAPLEVVVTADPYARWRSTRWRVDTQVGMPYPVSLYAERNGEVQVVAFDLSLVLGCELGERVHRRAREVDCVVEDAALQVAPWQRTARGAEVVEESDARLTGLKVRLQVTEEGAVTDVSLVGEPERTRRVGIQYENLRQLVSRAVLGFHLHTPERFVLGQDWVERNSRLFSIPAFRWVAIADGGLPTLAAPDSAAEPAPEGAVPRPSQPAALSLDGVVSITPSFPDEVRAPMASARLGRNAFDVLLAPASMGFSTVVHRMDAWKGRYLVQSRGEGAVDIGRDQPVTYKGELSAASVFLPDDGVMSERIWTLHLTPTASNPLADGLAGWSYWHHGRLTMLGADDRPDLGASGLVAWPRAEGRGQLPPWPALQ